jgi:Bax protein
VPGFNPVSPRLCGTGATPCKTLMKQTSDTTIAEPYQPSFTGHPDSPRQRNQENRQSAETISFGDREVDGLNVQAYLALGLLLIVALVVLLRFGTTLPLHTASLQNASLQNASPQTASPQTIYPNRQSVIRVESGDELVNLLKENGLWEISGKTPVPPLILSSYPGNIDELGSDAKKNVFLNSLVPVALVALAEVEKEKLALHEILAKFPGGYRNLEFSDEYDIWGQELSREEINFLLFLTRKYRTTRAKQLVNRVDVVPLSLLLAQAALESSWGTSRFAREANNLFGIWTWGEKGLIPLDREEGMTHKVAIYDSILDSIRAYLTMLNRLPPYLQFREIRRKSRNPLKLAEGLVYYSERGDSYVWELQNLIESNNLHRYDDCYLVAIPRDDPGLKAVKLDRDAAGNRV